MTGVPQLLTLPDCNLQNNGARDWGPHWPHCAQPHTRTIRPMQTLIQHKEQQPKSRNIILMHFKREYYQNLNNNGLSMQY